MGKARRSQSGGSEDRSSGGASKHKINASMSSTKITNMRKRRHNKTKNNISKLFRTLRATHNNSVIIVNSTDNLKRSASNSSLSPCSKRTRNDSCIVIEDDSEISCNASNNLATPRKKPTLQSSTPINSKSKNNVQESLTSNLNSLDNNNISKVYNEEVANLTREINTDSYLTIDLTTETLNSTNTNINNTTVIDLANVTETDNNDCSVVSVSNTSVSISGEGNVTVLKNSPSRRQNRTLQKVFNGLSNLNPTEKSKMLDFVLKQILNGCNVPENFKTSSNTKDASTCPVEELAEDACVKEDASTVNVKDTAEDTYIKEVILGKTSSRNSIGSNIYNPGREKNKTGLRMIVIDGSNVAMEHDKGKSFSVEGLKICIDYFLDRGHVVKAFVPRFRCKWGKSSCPRLLAELERRGLVVYTPSRERQGRMYTCYDDRYIVQCAAEFDGVIVSGDNYRDLLRENPRWRQVIENRVLPFTWVNNMIMFPRDPLGRNGPSLEQFLKHP